MRRAAVMGVALALLAPAAASAAYRPTAEITLDRTTPLSAPAITSVMRVPSGDDTTRTITARFPSTFSYNPAFSATGCTPEQASTFSCPDSSRIGTAKVSSPFGDGAGTVHLASDFRLVLLFDALAGLYRQRVYGTIRALDDGSFELTFDELPQIPVTESRIALEGGPHGMLMTPRRCGGYEMVSRFVSHAGAAVEQRLPIQISGCPAPLRVAGARASGGALSWRLQGPATGTDVSVLRAVTGGWREVASARLPAKQTTWKRSLRAGRYLALLRALGAGGSASPAKRVGFVVR